MARRMGFSFGTSELVVVKQVIVRRRRYRRNAPESSRILIKGA
jgi:hypothetical protein